MGVPALYLWLIKRCPQLIKDALDPTKVLSGMEEEGRSRNPGIDNLYLDMNGIIHPCCHHIANGLKKPQTEEDMFNNIFVYLDKVITIVNP